MIQARPPFLLSDQGTAKSGRLHRNALGVDLDPAIDLANEQGAHAETKLGNALMTLWAKGQERGRKRIGLSCGWKNHRRK